jgi:hypothetical protein
VSEPRSIALTRLALWCDPTRIQTWPKFLASLPEDALAPTPTDLGRAFVTTRMTSTGHAAAFDLVRNLAGLECKAGRLQLRGLGLLRRSPAGYAVSADGRALAAAYRANPAGPEWPRLFADALLGLEPRTRALIKRLSEEGAVLKFERDAWFAGSYRRARLVRTGEPDMFPLDAARERRTLRESLNDDAWWCLGEWRSDPCLEGATHCRFRGTRSEAFSLHGIGPALRAACEVLLVGGLLHRNGGELRLDRAAAIRLLPGRAADFGWLAGESESGNLMITLAQVLPGLCSATGHVVASELRNLLRARGVADPDRAIAAAQSEGRLLVYAEDYGQSRHGEGLFGDPRKQLVKLHLVGIGPGA